MIDEVVKVGIPRTQCTAIPCPITLSKNFGDKKWDKEKHPTFIFVSRVVRMKGIEEVIKAFSFIAKERDDAALWIVGGGEGKYIEQLKHMISEYGVEKQVTFFGRVSEEKKMELMARAHLLLHASVREGWGLVVLEAGFVGTPSVVYHVPGLCDVVHDGKTGIVIQNNSPRGMAEKALNLYLNTKQYALFQKNGKTWIQSLRWDTVAKQSLALCTTVSDR
jgi:glycosyltransferase involved in cell wall biosynthesis